MKPPSSWRSPLEAAALLLLLVPAATLTSAATTAPSTPPTQLLAAPSELTCDNIVVATDSGGAGSGKGGQHKYNLQALGGPHTVVTSEYTAPTWHNTTYTIDVCGALKRKGDVPAGERCPDGTRGRSPFQGGGVCRGGGEKVMLTGNKTVCAIKHRWDPKTGKTTGTDQVIPVVVGDDKAALAWEAARLPADGGDKANKDGKKEGLRLTLHGASTYQQRAQRTVVEFRCSPDQEGTEGEWESVDEYEAGKKSKRGEEKKEGEKKEGEKEGDKKDEDKKEGDKKDDESTPEKQLKKDGAALVWEGYKREKGSDGADMDTLYLTWYTKHACDAAVDEPPAKDSQSWGFFTWLVIL